MDVVQNLLNKLIGKYYMRELNSLESKGSCSLYVHPERSKSFEPIYCFPANRSIMEDALILCGFNAATARYLMGQGFVTPEELLLATEADLDTIARNVARSPPRIDGGGGTVAMPFIAMKH